MINYTKSIYRKNKYKIRILRFIQEIKNQLYNIQNYLKFKTYRNIKNNKSF